MQKEIAISVVLLLLFIGGLFYLAWPLTVAAQSYGRKSSKKEELGASLKRLKWNPRKQAAEEMKQGNHESGLAVGPGDVIKVETNLVVLDLFVTEQTKLRALTGLGKADFVVTEDGATQQVAMFSVGDNPSLPRSVVLIVDFSSSLSRYLEKSIEAAKMLVNRLGPKDEMAIVNDEVEVRGQESITSVADISGGWATYLESPERADELYERILADINQRYIIGYYPTNEERDGRLRNVRVEVRGHPEYVVHGRRSYYLRPH